MLVVSTTIASVLLSPLAGARTAALKTITVKVSDTTLKSSATSVPAGEVRFVIENVGKKGHRFDVNGHSTNLIKPGKRATLVVAFKKAGKYTYLVTLYHGRKGTLTVTAKTSSGGAGASAATLAAGEKLFKANCATCHTLKEAGTHGTVGPNLDNVKRSLSYIETQITNGGRFMPPFGASAGGSFSAAKIKEVAEFVYHAEHS
jgi:sulfite dehydrogenase